MTVALGGESRDPLACGDACCTTRGLIDALIAAFESVPTTPRECPRICVGMSELERHAHEEHAGKQDRDGGDGGRRRR
jgi:hypothetical protein